MIIVSSLLWVILVLSIAIPLLFIVGMRYVAHRVAGRPETHIAPTSESFGIPLPRFASRGHILRTVLLLVVLGTGTGIILLRYVYGIGPVTNLSNQFPWGLWIAIDVMGGVALAAGAFVMAATVHIFNIKRFEPMVRPAILTGFIGYLLAVAGLMVDLGRPYNVWRPLVYWQHYSVMWEVGLCVTFYSLVLFIEFLPVILEKVNTFAGVTKRLPTESLYRLLKKLSIVFIIAGVVLSTLHQSSLGSLWVLAPSKLSPIWYSLALPIFFFLSAVAAGLTMVIVESTLSSRAFKRGLEINLLASLGKAASIVLAIYLIVKGVDLFVRGAWPLVFEPTLQAGAFWAEIGLGVILPAIIFAFKPLRYKPAPLFGAASMVILFGILLNRVDVNIIGLFPYTGNIYVPTWMEFMVTITLTSFGVIAFALAARYLPVFSKEE
jgi:Ni/Fe-hydrogenase subunit HybB-like protein